MKRSKSTLEFSMDFCGNFGRILSLGQLVPDERKVNRDIYSNIHFVNTLEVTDPICVDKDLIEFRKKYEPELYAKGQKSIQ